MGTRTIVISETWIRKKGLETISVTYEIEIKIVTNKRVILRKWMKEQFNILERQQWMTIWIRSISREIILERDWIKKNKIRITYEISNLEISLISK